MVQFDNEVRMTGVVYTEPVFSVRSVSFGFEPGTNCPIPVVARGSANSTAQKLNVHDNIRIVGHMEAYIASTGHTIITVIADSITILNN